MTTEPQRSPEIHAASGRKRSWLAAIGIGVLWLTLPGPVLWAFGALWYDFPLPVLRHAAASGFAVGIVVVLVRGGRWWLRMGVIAAGFLAVLVWWFTLRPSNDRNWQPDVAETGWAEIDGDRVILHNMRHCDYRTETDYSPHWQTRTVDLSRLTGVDLAITFWGSEWMAHPIFSFVFSDGPPVCFSIETRKEVGEEYSAIGGFYRQYELIYVCSDERDVVRVRTNFRHGEEVYLYHLTLAPAQARQRFIEYVTAMNGLHNQPQWYNAATNNCTTSIRTQRAVGLRQAWDWRILLNGHADEMLYEQGAFAGDLPFAELKRRAHINDAARAAADAADFSQRIREGRPGFTPPDHARTPDGPFDVADAAEPHGPSPAVAAPNPQ